MKEALGVLASILAIIAAVITIKGDRGPALANQAPIHVAVDHIDLARNAHGCSITARVTPQHRFG